MPNGLLAVSSKSSGCVLKFSYYFLGQLVLEELISYICKTESLRTPVDNAGLLLVQPR